MALFQLACIGWLVVCAMVARSYSRVPSLAAFGSERGLPWPRVSVIVPARNEAGTVLGGLRTLLALDYPNLEVILVNDRSEDATGDLAESLSRDEPRLRVVHVDALPAGWLGKNNAMHRGAAEASGELLLFTDADVHFEASALRRSVAALLELGVDHLACAPCIACESFWEGIFVPFFALAFGLKYRPDRAAGPDPRYHIGIGAFNLIRREVYESIGGHSLLRMLVLDDMELGHLVKLRGYRQTGLRAGDLLRVRWTVGLSGIVHGLEKNAYAGFDYRLGYALFGSLVATVASVAPLVCAPSPLALAAWLAVAVLSRGISREAGGSPWAGLWLPLAGTMLAFVTTRSALLAERRRGIYWRGTFYSLAELRSASLV